MYRPVYRIVAAISSPENGSFVVTAFMRFLAGRWWFDPVNRVTTIPGGSRDYSLGCDACQIHGKTIFRSILTRFGSSKGDTRENLRRSLAAWRKYLAQMGAQR